MRRFIVRLSALGIVGLLALPIFSTLAVTPIPVDTDLDGGAWEDGVYLQVFTQRVFDEDGVAVGKEVTGCRLLVATTVDGVGETMTATDGEGSYQATVNPVYVQGDLYGGRATFGIVDPGVTISTTNTDVAVSETCPGGDQVE